MGDSWQDVEKDIEEDGLGDGVGWREETERRMGILSAGYRVI